MFSAQKKMGTKLVRTFHVFALTLLSVLQIVPNCTAQVPGQQNTDASSFVRSSPASCKALGTRYIFSVSALGCMQCPLGQIASADALSCECSSNGQMSYVSSADGPTLSCYDCSQLQLSVTFDRTTCVPCGNNTILVTPAVSVTLIEGTPSVTSIPTVSNASNQTSINVTSISKPSCTYSVEPYVKHVGTTALCGCPLGYVVTDYNSSGVLAIAQGKFCIPCPFNSYVDLEIPTVCKPCPDINMRRSPTTGKCECTGDTVEDSILVAKSAPEDIPYVGMHVCIKRSVASLIPQLFSTQTFDYVMDVEGARTASATVERSEPFMKYFLAAATRCTETRHWKSCQALANLCVLSLYKEDAPACKVYSDLTRPIITKDVNGFPGWTAFLPWLIYEQSFREIMESTAINRDMALSGPNSLMNLTLSVYTLDGTYMGMEDLSSQLMMCTGEGRDLTRFLTFGTNTVISCRIDLQAVISTYGEPYFYELWISDKFNSDGSERASGPVLYPVQAIISNYKVGDETPNQVLVDQPNNELLPGDPVLSRIVGHRRFFLWDNVSGRKVSDADSRARQTATPSQENVNSAAQVVRWAKYMELRVKLRGDDPRTPQKESVRIFPPYMLIEYDQQMVTTVPLGVPKSGDKQEVMRYPTTKFRSVYHMDLSEYWRISMILFIVLVVLIVIAFGMKVSIRNQSYALDPVGMLSELFGTVADGFFWGLWIMCGYWFFFFKLQASVKVLLPLENPHQNFLVMIITSIVCKSLQVLLLMYQQCTVDLFFVDWEKEKVDPDAPPKPADKEKSAGSNVSVWRSILIANEWCEMQGARHTDIDFTLMFLLLFLAGLDFQYLSTIQPVSTDLSPNIQNYALRFFVITMWYFFVVFIQLVWKAFVYRFQQDPLDLYVDLCQLANISTFILDQQFHGYYIHGRAVHPCTDVDMYTMQANLQAESDGNLPYRGLTQMSRSELNGATDQVFEMYITEKIREDFSHFLDKLTANSGGNWQRGGKGQAELVAKVYHDINQYLTINVVDEIVNFHGSEVVEPSMAHKLIGMPPPKIREHPVMLRDNRQMFSRVLLYGIEYDLVIFDLLAFVMWDMIFKDIFIAALMTYVIAHGLIELRCTFGSSNISKKSLVDQRFLV